MKVARRICDCILPRAIFGQSRQVWRLEYDLPDVEDTGEEVLIRNSLLSSEDRRRLPTWARGRSRTNRQSGTYHAARDSTAH
jgi:hypothetical protein